MRWELEYGLGCLGPGQRLVGVLGLPKVARHFPKSPKNVFFFFLIVGSPVILKMVIFQVAPFKAWRFEM